MPQDEPSAPPPAAGRDPERLALEVALKLGVLGSFAWLVVVLLRPFAGLLLWSIVIAAALHPAQGWLARSLGGRPRLAAAVVTLAALLVLIGPILALGDSLILSAEWLFARIRGGGIDLPDPPAAIVALPGIGPEIAANWSLAATNLEALIARHGRALLAAGEAAAGPALRVAQGTLVFLVAVVVSGFLHLPGEGLAAATRHLAARTLGPRSAGFVDIAVATIRTVARGVVGVAAIQALLVGVGLIAAGVPAAGLLTLAALVLAIVQVGVWPVVAPVLAWIWLERGGLDAALLTAWLIPVGLVDVPLKPLMLGKALRTPPLVILAGVIGGTISYGLIGLFVGPVLLALGYEILRFALYGDATAVGRGGIE